MAGEGIYPKHWIDTMLIERIILGGDPTHKGASLAATLKRYFNYDMSKDAQTTFSRRGFTTNQLDYAANDVRLLFDLVEAQRRSSRYNPELIKLEMDYLNIVIEMQDTGMRVDVDSWMEVVNDVTAKAEAATEVMKKYADINWNSPKQVVEGFRVNKFYTHSTSKPILQERDGVPIVKDFLAFKEQMSLKSKLGLNFLEKVTEDGTIHTRYNQILSTGRTSSSAVNLQNIPKDYRKYFLPRTPGNVFVRADYSQQELIILGYAADEKVWIDTAKRGEDLHRMCAMYLFPEFAQATEEQQGEMRKKVKMINFSLSYGVGLDSLASSIGLDRLKTAKLRAAYFAKFPKIEQHLAKLSREAKTARKTETLAPFKRVRLLKHEKPGAMGRKGKNSPIQGTGADMTKLACVMLDEKNLPLKIIHNIHDEIVVECHPDDAEMVLEKLIESMEEAGEVIIPGGLIHAEGNICLTWE